MIGVTDERPDNNEPPGANAPGLEHGTAAAKPANQTAGNPAGPPRPAPWYLTGQRPPDPGIVFTRRRSHIDRAIIAGIIIIFFVVFGVALWLATKQN